MKLRDKLKIYGFADCRSKPKLLLRQYGVQGQKRLAAIVLPAMTAAA